MGTLAADDEWAACFGEQACGDFHCRGAGRPGRRLHREELRLSYFIRHERELDVGRQQQYRGARLRRRYRVGQSLARAGGVLGDEHAQTCRLYHCRTGERLVVGPEGIDLGWRDTPFTENQQDA